MLKRAKSRTGEWMVGWGDLLELLNFRDVVFPILQRIESSSETSSSVSYDSLMTDRILDIKLPKFLPNYKNPCFSLNDTFQ